MTQKPLVMERTFSAPIAKVWQAITNKDQMKQWYFDIPDFRPEVGATFSFPGECEGEKFTHNCKVVAVEENKLLKHTWRYEGYEGDSVVTFELFDEDGATRFRLTHEGLETFPEKVAAFARSNFEAGWNELIGSMLPGFLAKENAEAATA